MNDAHPVTRRFSLADGMIAVAASAATLALARLTTPIIADIRQAYYVLRNVAIARYNLISDRLFRINTLDSRISFLVQAIILVWMAAYAAMRLRRPRPPLRVVALQPGMVASWAAASAFALRLLTLIVGGEAVVGVPVQLVVRLAVPLAWGTLKAARRWRPEPSWLDRLGRTLGVCWWVVTWFGSAFLGYLTAMWDTP